MKIPVLVEPQPNGGFRGTSLSLAAEGATKTEVLSLLRALVDDRLEAGASFDTLEVPDAKPWMQWAGDMKDDPLFEEWQEAIQEYRHEQDGED